MRARLREILPLLVLLGLCLPFLGKPVHIDEANFLTLARGAAADPWRPHEVLVNWQGHAERAFDVLSNPPGVAWMLAPLLGLPLWVSRAAMLLWLGLAVPAATRLGARAGVSGSVAALLIVGSPIGLWAAGSLTPDLPLLALTLVGMAELLGGRRWLGALLLGCAALFRYSGLALIPLVALWPWLNGRRREALLLGLVTSLPILALSAHDLLAYGRPHLLAMVGFQSVADTDRELLRKGAACLAMLGGAGVLPVLAWGRPRAAALGLALGAALGLGVGSLSGQGGVALATSVLACGAGGATLGGAVRARDRLDAFLWAWISLGAAFLVTLRFAATRYELPFLAPVVLLGLRAAGPRLARLAVPLTLALGALLCLDDNRLARAQERLAAEVLEAAHGEAGLIAGHWGIQWYLQNAGWTPLEDDTSVPPGTLLAVSAVAWPQTPAPGCLEPVGRWSVADPWPVPRVHTAEGAANLHANVLSADPPVESYAPWGFGRDPLDTVTLWRGCQPATPGSGPSDSPARAGQGLSDDRGR